METTTLIFFTKWTPRKISSLEMVDVAGERAPWRKIATSTLPDLIVRKKTNEDQMRINMSIIIRDKGKLQTHEKPELNTSPFQAI